MAPVIVFSVVVLVFLIVAYASFHLVKDYGKVGFWTIFTVLTSAWIVGFYLSPKDEALLGWLFLFFLPMFLVTSGFLLGSTIAYFRSKNRSGKQ